MTADSFTYVNHKLSYRVGLCCSITTIVTSEHIGPIVHMRSYVDIFDNTCDIVVPRNVLLWTLWPLVELQNLCHSSCSTSGWRQLTIDSRAHIVVGSTLVPSSLEHWLDSCSLSYLYLRWFYSTGTDIVDILTVLAQPRNKSVRHICCIACSFC